MKKIHKAVIWAAVLFFMATIYAQTGAGGRTGERIAFSDFLAAVNSGSVEKAIIRNREIEGVMSDGSRFRTSGILYDDLIKKLQENNVSFDFDRGDSVIGAVAGIAFSWLPFLIIAGVWFMIMRQMQSGGNKALNFGRSKARMMSSGQEKILFKDVAGVDEAIEELSEIVDFLKNPAKFTQLGGKIPKGCLLTGPPGTGKTLMAKAISGEAGVPFFSISGSDFVEMFVGVGASRVRDMFEQGKKHAPCIIFIDEIDAVGRHRGIGLGGGSDEREQTLNQLLVEMDGFNANEGVIIIAATNRPDVLDQALLRPGRFDRRISISLPDVKGRTEILNIHCNKLKLGPDVNIDIIARSTPGFSGAELFNLANEGAILAARRNKKVIMMSDFEDAKDKVLMGAEKKSMVMKEEERKLTAYHEAGHAIVAAKVPGSDPIHKATIMPRGRALGLVMRLPKDDRLSLTREKMLADLAVAMGGRVAEELCFGKNKVTSGASSDIKQCTALARAMVLKWGMSDKVGPIFYGEEETVQDKVERYHAGEDEINTISAEVKKLVEEAIETAKKIITDNMDSLKLLAEQLIEHETLSGDEINIILSGEKLTKMPVQEKEVKISSFEERIIVDTDYSKDGPSSLEEQDEGSI